MIRKLKEYQKIRILKLKHYIINSDNILLKNKAYNILIKAIKFYHKPKIKIYKNNISIDYKIDNVKISAKDTIIFSIGCGV